MRSRNKNQESVIKTIQELNSEKPVHITTIFNLCSLKVKEYFDFEYNNDIMLSNEISIKTNALYFMKLTSKLTYS